MRNRRRVERGMTLLELLIVVAIIGILAAIGVANYLSALNKARQKRTVADMRLIAGAWEARAAEKGAFQVSGFTFPTTAVSWEDLRSVLVPTYARALPKDDGWNRPLQFGVTPGTATDDGSYAIRSPGRDGVYDATPAEGATTDPDCDIIFSDGTFVSYPEVMQRED